MCVCSQRGVSYPSWRPRGPTAKDSLAGIAVTSGKMLILYFFLNHWIVLVATCSTQDFFIWLSMGVFVVSGCFCKSSKDTSRVASPVHLATGSHSGSQTPKNPPPADRGGRQIAKDLKRVKRALKTLGVNIIEYEEHGFDGDTCLRYVEKSGILFWKISDWLLKYYKFIKFNLCFTKICNFCIKTLRYRYL